MADSKLTLPGNFEAGKVYLVEGDTLIAWRKALMADRAVPGRGLKETQGPTGRILTPDVALGPIYPPFWVELVAKGTPEIPEFFAKVHPGYVIERLTGSEADDALKNHEPANLRWGGDAPEGVDPSDSREFAITDNQQISVVVHVKGDGVIGITDEESSDEDVDIAIEAEDAASTHYEALGGDIEEGTDGVYHYKLGVFRNPGDGVQPYIENFLGGSHIGHFVDLPLLENTIIEADSHFGDMDPETGQYGKGARLFKKYDPAQNRHLFRHLVCNGDTEEPNTMFEACVIITEDSDTVRIRVLFDPSGTYVPPS